MTVAELRASLENVDDDKEVVVRIPLVKGVNGIIKSVVDCRPKAVDTMFIINIDKLNKVQEEQLIPQKEDWE